MNTEQLPAVLDPIWSLAFQMYEKQCKAWRVPMRWTELDADVRLDWWILADRKLNHTDHPPIAQGAIYANVAQGMRA